MPEHTTIEELIEDREAFNAFIYTPLDQAIQELSTRAEDLALQKMVADTLSQRLPDLFQDKKIGILFRQLATPNYEMRRFVSILDAIEGIVPVFWEYYSDKFTSNNEYKHSLGKLHYFLGKGKKGGVKIDTQNIIDFNKYNGEKISDVKTLWGQSLVSFHHELFEKEYGKVETTSFFDASKWFAGSGGSAKEYYTNFITLFVKNGILFENFMLDEKELSFTTEVFLPAFIEVWQKTGKKPLIVALEPTDIEGDKFWICHTPEVHTVVQSKLNSL